MGPRRKRDAFLYADLWPRFLALGVDFGLFVALFLPITRLVKGIWILGAADHRWAQAPFITEPLCLVFLFFMFLCFVLLEGLGGATVGKRFLVLRSPERARFGGRMAGTRVVRVGIADPRKWADGERR